MAMNSGTDRQQADPGRAGSAFRLRVPVNSRIMAPDRIDNFREGKTVKIFAH